MADEDGRRRLGRLVVRSREAQGLERKDLARQSELSYPYIAQIENGDREPSLRALQSIAAALALPVNDLTTALEADPMRTGSVAGPRTASYISNPLYAAASPMSQPLKSTRRSKGSTARRSVVAELHELLERLEPQERLTALGELQGLVLADVVRAEVVARL